MKLIINTTNLNGGGAFQVGFSFIYECMKYKEHEYHVFLCSQISNQIVISDFPDNFHFYNFSIGPSITLKGIKTIKELTKFEKILKPDLVFSIFGPTYWTPKSLHLMGYAIPHFLYTESPYFKKIDLVEKIKWSFKKKIKRYFLKKNAKYFHVETEDARIRLSKFLSCSIDNIYTVSNTYNSIYNTANLKEDIFLPPKQFNEFRFVCISAYYDHKNLEILNKVIPLLKNEFINIRFVLTLDNYNFISKFTKEAKEKIINIGAITMENCPQLYSECDAVFLPTLLECFSANYPEAMKMEKPIITSNLSFSKDICEDAAIYFNPLDEIEIVNSIRRIIYNKSLQNELIINGKERLFLFNSASERAEKYLNICTQILRMSKK